LLFFIAKVHAQSDPLPSWNDGAAKQSYVSTRATELLKTKGQADEARRLCEQGIAFGKDRVREHPRDVEIRMHLVLQRWVRTPIARKWLVSQGF